MTVKEIFELRKQGKIEEAYEAIRPVYAVHKGKYTTLCMFWTAADVFKLRLEQGRVEEAENIYKALLRLIPSIEDDERHSAANFMHYAEGRLIKAAIEREESQAGLSSSEREQARAKLKASEKFRKRYFAIRDKKKHEKSETLISTNEPLINEKLTDNLRQFALTEKDNPCNSCNPCSQTRPEADVSAISALSARQEKVLACIREHPGFRVPGLESETGIPAKSVERHIKVLIERNLIEHRGSKKTGGYHALK